ncbi:hypothetical protein GCM10022251_34530 [Phytohabitans flavus]|uniref:Lipocalin-like domain-containing protein n=1 Tax=Phytohabitans flavus TaxID=1076124 RepID=A0A6F8XN16_9ACTN|nr:hypothetical protein [Phytohabitans flavus]BCB75189.1 hypothetical protein Pflav_015990 [Phytohabitans flavus]
MGGKGVAGLTGRWRIVSMDLWDSDTIDLTEPAYIEFDGDQTGRFGFIAVEGWMDCRQATRDGKTCVEFTWEGNDEGDPANGRGWVTLADSRTINGHIYFHLGDDSGFQAVRT